jgi:hypothetical protein
MALSLTQRAQVRLYCGWSARFWQMDSRLEQAMNALASNAEEETIVTDLLTQLVAHDARFTAAYTRLKALAVGKITLPGHGELMALRSEGRRFSGRLASILGVAIRHDVWSGRGPSEFASTEGMVGSDSSGYIRQGS